MPVCGIGFADVDTACEWADENGETIGAEDT